MQADQLQRAIFILDALEGEKFDGYTCGEIWNGFECPYFPFETAMKLMKISGNLGYVGFYDKEADMFVYSYEEEGEDASHYTPVHVDVLGKLYPIGAFDWAWDKL